MNDTTANQNRNLTRRRNRIQTVRRWIGSFLVVIATLGVIAFLAWKKYEEIQAAMNTPPPPEMPVAVGIRPAGTLQWRQSTTSIGTILAPRSITVNNEMPGTVAEVLFQPGQIVEEEERLLSLDSSVERAQLKAAMIREEFALSTLQRNKQLAASISDKELDDVESLWKQSQAEVEELQAMIARKTIIAPFRARVGLSDVQKGQYLSVGSFITTLQSVEDHVLVEFTLAQYVVSKLQTGDTILIASDDSQLTATISAIDAQADRQTRNVRVRARLDNPPPAISPGDSVSVKVEYRKNAAVASGTRGIGASIASGHVRFSGGRKRVRGTSPTAQPVVLATSAGSVVGIASGISVEDRVIVEGSFKLQDGALISAVEREPAQAPENDQ